MGRLFISNEEIQEILERLSRIEKAVALKQKHPEQVWYDNSELCQVMNISKGTASEWRRKGYVKARQVGNKFYYLQSDIIELLKTNNEAENGK